MRVIINADDLGMNRAISERILSLMSRGCLTSATLMANGEDIEWAAGETAKYPHCSFGVHLNLTEFSPLTSGQGLELILDADRCFAGNRIRDVKLTSSLRNAVYHEWCAQIERVLELGVKVSHLDSHHHTHTIPGLFLTLKRVQQRYGIRKVRLTKNIYAGGGVSMLLLARKAAWNFALRHYYRTKTTAFFTTFKEFYNVLRGGRESRLELVESMAHPGSAAYEEETRLLEAPWRNEAQEKIDLISYNDL